MSEITPVTHTEKVVAGQVDAVTHFEKVIAKYGSGNVYESLEAGTNILIEETADGKAKISASGEVSSEDTVARAEIAAIKNGETLDSFGDVETALGDKQNTISDLATIRSGAALGATAVQPETGKGLSTNDYTTAEKTKLAGIAEGAEVNVQSNWTQTTTTADDYIKNKPTLGTAAALDVAASGNASTSQVVKGNDTRLSDARNAADVSAWAKAANKPSYAGSEIPLTGYSEAQSKASVAATDTTNAAIGKLEYRVESNENNISSIGSQIMSFHYKNDTPVVIPYEGDTRTSLLLGFFQGVGNIFYILEVNYLGNLIVKNGYNGTTIADSGITFDSTTKQMTFSSTAAGWNTCVLIKPNM